MHLLNHTLGILSLELSEQRREFVGAIWHNSVGQVALYGSFLIHFCLALVSLYRRRTWRMPKWEAIQVGLGLLIIPLLLNHVIGTRGATLLLNVDPSYEYVITALWISLPWRGLQQAFVLLIIWGHLCIGLHFWLRLKKIYRHAIPYLYPMAVLVPILALAGFARTGFLLERKAQTPGFYARVYADVIAAPPEKLTVLKSLELYGWMIFGICLGIVVIARLVRQFKENRHKSFTISLPQGRLIAVKSGQTLLESLRAADIPHASICGGRGRCTTCRVQVVGNIEDLPAIGDLEQAALKRINAESDVRLACQLRPTSDISVLPLLPPNTTARDIARPGTVHGREQHVAILFIDLRQSTQLGEDRLAYDFLFLLNQFFAEMAQALTETNGHYANFTGDGLMAIYGLKGETDEACKQALQGAAKMTERLHHLNDTLQKELRQPLKMGIGIHYGEVIIGSMGPPEAQNVSAIGDSVNISARLEALTKEFNCDLVISEAAARAANLDLSSLNRHVTPVRGREQSITIYAIQDPRTVLHIT